MIQPQINSLSSAGQYRSALKIMQEDLGSYGPNNQLLFFLDYGLLAHWSKAYDESEKAFEKAKQIYDALYTTSLSNELSTWVINDQRSPYRGEDFERVMINLFAAMSYAQQGKLDEALVEARDVDNRLKLFNQKYLENQKNTYKEDAWARFLMGLMYEARGTRQDLEDAYIEYKHALEIYETDFKRNYGVDVPQILRENFISLSKYLGREDSLEGVLNGFSQTYQNRQKMAEVYVVQYDGLSPMKTSFSVVLPLPGGIVGQLAFPQYSDRIFDPVNDSVKAVDSNSQEVALVKTELTDDIGAIARKNLENRKTRVIAKAAFRSTGKYVLEAIALSQIEKKNGSASAIGFGILSSVFNLMSEQPDLRSWQTLPATIRLAKLQLSEGNYKIFCGDKLIDELQLIAGQKKFYYLRTLR